MYKGISTTVYLYLGSRVPDRTTDPVPPGIPVYPRPARGPGLPCPAPRRPGERQRSVRTGSGES